MSVNPDIVRTRCAEIDQAVARLEELRSLSREALLADQDLLDVACYRLLVAIEAALALCFHVSAKQLKKIPEEYAGCFTNLQEAGLVSADLADRLRQMARFRNLLVHVYWKIDYGQVYEVLQTRLGDLRAFRTAMTQIL
jgi:uncharacterized protein YutE (UPF0331/DUF86 family)